eukprot:9471215-Pyramimonas_sp.AAC.1
MVLPRAPTHGRCRHMQQDGLVRREVEVAVDHDHVPVRCSLCSGSGSSNIPCHPCDFHRI